MARIDFRKDDIFEAGTDALVNTVNCVGAMGRGVALQFKKAYPANFKAYKAACDAEQVQPGHMFIHETGKLMPRFIINFPTKRHWRGKSRIEDIESGLVALTDAIKTYGIKSVAIPPLGAGLGGLEWDDVKPRIKSALQAIPDLHVMMFEPNGAPKSMKSHDVPKVPKVPKMTAGRAALVVLMQQYLRGLLDPVVTLIEVHKLLYFMQEAGQPLRLAYVKHGPYARNLRHVLGKIEGHFVAGYRDNNDAPFRELTIVPGAYVDAERFLDKKPKVWEHFGRVADLVDGFETPEGLELLATVHWVATREGAISVKDAVDKIHDWNERKKIFTPRQIGIAFDRLRSKNWLTESDSVTHSC